MRIKLSTDGHVILPTHMIRIYSDITKLTGLNSFLSDSGYVYAFSYDEANSIIQILIAGRASYELSQLIWYDQIVQKLANQTFASEEAAVPSLCAIQGSSTISENSPLNYSLLLPPQVDGGQYSAYVKLQSDTGIGTLIGPSSFYGDCVTFTYQFVGPGDYHIDLKFDTYTDGIDVTVQYPITVLQQMKIDEMNTACNNEILGGFTSSASGTAYTYDFDYEAQMNFNGMLTTITTGMYTGTIAWKARELEDPITLTVDQFKQLCMDGLNHKMQLIEKYRTLKAQILAATDYSAIENIAW